jgi:hypothetical protein
MSAGQYIFFGVIAFIAIAQLGAIADELKRIRQLWDREDG